MAKELVLMNKCLGVRNKGSFLQFNPETGETELKDACNIFIDKEGKIKRRNGKRVLSSVVGRKDGFGTGSTDCLVKLGNSLYRMGSDYGLTGLRSGMLSGKCSFSKMGQYTYYTDGSSNGMVKEGGVSEMWAHQEYVGPTTTRNFSNPPLGTLLCGYRDRMYVSVGRV